MEGSSRPKKDGVCGWCGRGTQHRDHVVVPPDLSPKPYNPVFVHMTLVCSELEPRVSGYEGDFVY